ncbi:cyclase family protein [Dactylosporangium salmoneum]|uniref:Cyclase family protein n=1 Tax=Dactylosporangium salmoneum TaxID=53361 RepID=A0ABN3HLB8_9ACTN
MSRIVDLSHPVRAGMITYPGMPGPVLSDYLTREAAREIYSPGTDFHIGRIEMIANTGTYLDTPAHRFDGGADLAAVPLERVADLAGTAVDTAGLVAITAAHLDKTVPGSVADGALIIGTGWSRHFGTDHYGAEDAPFLTADAVDWIVARRPALVGIDSVNIDSRADGRRPAHTGLLAAGIFVVEHLTNLAALPATGFRFTAVPPKVEGMGTFTVRAFAVLS